MKVRKITKERMAHRLGAGDVMSRPTMFRDPAADGVRGAMADNVQAKLDRAVDDRVTS